jgi:hypothetical protein
VDGPDDVWGGLLGGTVRGAAAARAQPPEIQERLREAIADALAPRRAGEGYALAISAHVASGRRP